jgi:hypothetical protein
MYRSITPSGYRSLPHSWWASSVGVSYGRRGASGHGAPGGFLPRTSFDSGLPTGPWRCTWWAVWLSICLFLQLKASYFVYRLLSPLQVINFPWRMLAFITPIGIVLVVVIADGLMRTHPNEALWGGLAAAWVCSLIVLSPVVPLTSGVATSFYSMSAFTAPKAIDYRTFGGYFTTADYPKGPLYTVFLPRVLTPNGREITSSATGYLYARLHGSQGGAQSLTDVPCSVLGPTDAPLETLQLTFSVNCAGATRLALPVSYNGYSSIFVEVVHLPTLWGTLF